MGEVLLLQREPTNIKDSLAVSVMKSTLVVGHIPTNLSALFSYFLSRTCNKCTAEVTGARLNVVQAMPRDIYPSLCHSCVLTALEDYYLE